MFADDRILTREECIDIVGRIRQFSTREGAVSVKIHCWWNGELQWARNRTWIATDRRDVRIDISRRIEGGSGSVSANQLDDASLRAAVAAAERIAKRTATGLELKEFLPPPPPLPTSVPTIWSDATYRDTVDARSAYARALIEESEREGMLSAGYIEMRAGAAARTGGNSGSLAWDRAQEEISVTQSSSTPITYTTYTQAQCSLTVRHPRGIGSGWAGLSGYDWAKIDGKQLASRALKKCLASFNPVKIEPGRYTTILEPQAVCDLMEPLMGSFSRSRAEDGLGPWVLGFDGGLQLWRTKLGTKVVDERITVSQDPDDPELGVLTPVGMTPITWIERGVLKSLEYMRTMYALPRLNDPTDAQGRPAFRMSGGHLSIDEMVQTTKRGLLVTRLSGVRMLDNSSVLSTGLTRDGLWLIENGKISKAVHNMRFTESPLFVLNQIEALGEPVPVFRPMLGAYNRGLRPAIVPPVKAKDFSFTSLSDAV